MLGRSVRDLAEEVDAALGRLASAKHQEQQCEESLAQARQMVADAQADVDRARDELFTEHPDLAPRPTHRPPVSSGGIEGAMDVALLPGQDPSKFEPVEVDDDNDPRFTAGASVVSASDDADLPPVEWEEHDG